MSDRWKQFWCEKCRELHSRCECDDPRTIRINELEAALRAAGDGDTWHAAFASSGFDTNIIRAAIDGDEDAAEGLGRDIEDTAEALCDEVDRLRERIAELEQQLHDAGDGDTWHAACKRLESEVERLREAIGNAAHKLSCTAIERQAAPEIVQVCDRQALGTLLDAIGGIIPGTVSRAEGKSDGE